MGSGRFAAGILGLLLRAAWDIDRVCRGDDTWVPPIITALVTAVRATTLGRLDPGQFPARAGVLARVQR